jgi:hypothetical protein
MGYAVIPTAQKAAPKNDFSLDEKNGPLFRDPIFNGPRLC